MNRSIKNVIAASLGTAFALTVYYCCPEILIPINPTVNAPNEYGALVDTTTADSNSIIINVKVVKLGIGFVRECMLLFELSSGETVSLALSTSGDVTLKYELAAEEFEVDEEKTQLWNGFAEHGVSLIKLQQYLRVRHCRGRLCRYNRIERHSGVFVCEVRDHFYPPVIQIAVPFAPLINSEEIVVGNNGKVNNVAPPVRQVVAPLTPPQPPALRIFPAVPQGWVDGSQLT